MNTIYIAFSILVGSSTCFAMTEFEVMLCKNYFSQQLKHSIAHPNIFQKYYATYQTFLTTHKLYDPNIKEVLKSNFHKAMREQCSLLTQQKRAIQTWQSQIKNRKVLKDMNKGSVFAGISLYGLSSSLALIGSWTFMTSLLQTNNPIREDGVVVALSLLGALATAAAGTHKIAKGWNYTNYLQNKGTALALLDSNYSYIFPNEEKLSIQMGPIIES